jgi:hypothetical protein
MKRVAGLLICLMILSFAGVAGAVPWRWTDEMKPADRIHVYQGYRVYKFTHNINDNGFNALQDSVTGYVLAMNFSGGDKNAKFKIALPVSLVKGRGSVKAFKWENDELGISMAGLIKLNLDGTLSVKIRWSKGDFYLEGSKLVARGNETSPAPVPEPSTLLLMGSGLAGVAAWGRFQPRWKRRSKRSTK